MRAFLRETLPAVQQNTGPAASWTTHSPEFSRALGARGWIGMTWPKQYGGRERSFLDRYIVTEELLAAGAPVGAHWVADRQTGPAAAALRHRGAAAARSCPASRAGEIYFSHRHERARLRLRPRLGAHPRRRRSRAAGASPARRCGPARRTATTTSLALCAPPPDGGPPQAGLSPADRRPETPRRHDLADPLPRRRHHFNEVAFEDVFVPDDMLLGEMAPAGSR